MFVSLQNLYNIPVKGFWYVKLCLVLLQILMMLLLKITPANLAISICLEPSDHVVYGLCTCDAKQRKKLDNHKCFSIYFFLYG